MHTVPHGITHAESVIFMYNQVVRLGCPQKGKMGDGGFCGRRGRCGLAAESAGSAKTLAAIWYRFLLLTLENVSN